MIDRNSTRVRLWFADSRSNRLPLHIGPAGRRLWRPPTRKQRAERGDPAGNGWSERTSAAHSRTPSFLWYIGTSVPHLKGAPFVPKRAYRRSRRLAQPGQAVDPYQERLRCRDARANRLKPWRVDPPPIVTPGQNPRAHQIKQSAKNNGLIQDCQNDECSAVHTNHATPLPTSRL